MGQDVLILKKPTPVRPPVSREVYTLTSMEKVFPGGEWVDESELEGPSDREAEPDEGSRLGSRPSSITVIGGTKFDADSLERALRDLPAGYSVISGGNRGAEKFALETAEKMGLTPVRVIPDQDLFGAKANDVHVEHVLITDIDSTLIIAGDGVRSKQAKAWVNRARWPREVVVL